MHERDDLGRRPFRVPPERGHGEPGRMSGLATVAQPVHDEDGGQPPGRPHSPGVATLVLAAHGHAHSSDGGRLVGALRQDAGADHRTDR